MTNSDASQNGTDGQQYFPTIETHLIESKYVAQTFKVQVMQPLCKRGEGVRFPVVYATDGNLAFDVLKGISYTLQSQEREAPRFILVGIGYPGDCPLAGVVLRARDLTFPGYPKLSIKPPPIEGVLVPEKGVKNFYGAEEFQQFIEQELTPLIDEKYATLPGERTYFGHSGGGGFGLFTLFTKSDLFKNYIVSSPGLIYHGESSAGIQYENYDFMLEYARTFVASRRSLRGVKLFMSVGIEEEFEPTLAQWQLTSSFYRMTALLRAAAIPGLELRTEAFQGEFHATVWPMAFIHGVRAVLGNIVRMGEGDS